MASNSVSLHKAQVPLSCHFCNESTIQWKCEDCDVFMCTSCKEKIHHRLKSAQDHDIVSVSNICKENRPQREVVSEVITSVFNSYTTTVPAISSLLCSGDDVIYFLNHKLTEVEETVRLVKGKMLKSSIRIMQTLDKRIFDIAVNKEGEILFNEFSNNHVCVLAHSGETKAVLDTSPMKSLALHVNKDNEIIIGIREQGPAFPVKEFSVRQVLIFDNDYKRKVILETDTKGRKLFNYPARIKTDSKKVLYVADWMEKVNTGRIVAVDVNGRLKFTYKGNQDLSQSFCPNGIAITSSDTIILSDDRNNALHALNSRGELLGIHFVDKEYNIEKPYSLCIDSEGYLIIGNGFPKGNKATIYVTKIADEFV